MRVTDMKGVDLSRYVFDYDLTFAVLLMHPGGHVYHQYGNRTPESPDSHLSMESLARVMRDTLSEHAAFPKDHRVQDKTMSVDELPTMRSRIEAGKAPECFHCHMVFQAHDELAQEQGTFEQAAVWRWPPSTRIGLHLDRDDQRLVTDVDDGSPAHAAGLRSGDRVVSLGDRAVRTEGDVQWVLDRLDEDGAEVTVTFTRGGAEKAARIVLPEGWRVGTPDELWRASMWRLDPRPGFGGPMLSSQEKERLGIAAEVAAFRVKYVVTWGDQARTGRNAHEAGLRKGDVVLSVGGRSDFRSPQHFHAWFRLTREVGETVPIEVLRGDERRTIELTVID